MRNETKFERNVYVFEWLMSIVNIIESEAEKKNINGFDAKKYCKNNWVEDEATSERMAKK